MSQESKESSGTEGKRRVLQGYQQKGKRFIPPFLQQAPMSESRWMEDRVPELIWIALLNRVYGVKEGTALATSIARVACKCEGTSSKAYAALSDYMGLEERLEECIRRELIGVGVLKRAVRGLATLVNNYPEFPLGFLSDPGNRTESILGSTLDSLKKTIADVTDRESVEGIFVQATVVYIHFINGKLTVPPGTGLANFPAIEDYPHTEESLRVAASVRSSVTFLLRPEVTSGWSKTFWRQGRTLEMCEVLG